MLRFIEGGQFSAEHGLKCQKQFLFDFSFKTLGIYFSFLTTPSVSNSFCPVSKVLHTTTINWFWQFKAGIRLIKSSIYGLDIEKALPLYSLWLEAIVGQVSPLWCRLLLASPWLRSELNSEKCLCAAPPPPPALSTKFRHSFLMMRDQICCAERGLFGPLVKTDKGHNNGIRDWFFWSHSWIWHRNFDPAVKLNHCGVRVRVLSPPHCTR